MLSLLMVFVVQVFAQQTLQPANEIGTKTFNNTKAELYRATAADPTAILTVHGPVAKAMWESFTEKPYSHRGILARRSKDQSVGCFHYSNPEAWECYVNYER